MPDHDQKPHQPDFKIGDIAVAAAMLSRLPALELLKPDFARSAQAAWAFPVIGILIGAITGLVLAGLMWMGVAAGVSAALALGLSVLLTGALHEDGLADTADGLGGGKTKQAALDIMRDSRVGAYGVVALSITSLARWAGLAAIATSAPLAAPILAATLSRMPMVLVMAGMQPARSDGLSHAAGRPAAIHAGAALGIAAGMALILGGMGGIGLIAAALISSIPIIFWASKKLNGQTGDILGATQQGAEVAVLAVATVLFV